jgi:hypothetical protein
VKKLLILCLFVVSCAHVQLKKDNDSFCNQALELFHQKLIGIQEYLLAQDGIKNAIFSNQKMECENNIAYAGFTLIMEGDEGKCVLINSIISFTDTGKDIVYKLEYTSEGEIVKCLTASST